MLQAVMRISDRNGDGEINFEEFLAVVISKTKVCQQTLFILV